MSNGITVRETKNKLRELMLQARRNMSPEEISREDAALVAHATAYIRSLAASETTIATYAPIAGEPGGRMFLDALHTQASDLLLPIAGPAGQMEWAHYQGALSMQQGQLGIPEPTGPRLGADALAACDIVFMPALGVSPEGYRLGKGGGYYDRALARLVEGDRHPRTVVLLYNGEIRSDIPVEDHDMPVDMVITPTGVREFS